MDQEQLAMTDSAQFAPVILEKRRAEMRRDSALNQVRLIQAIDDDRFVWPHLLAEISKAVPAFTWLSEVLFIGEAVSPAAPIPVNQAALDSAATPADSAALLVPRSDPTRPRPPLRFTISGYTADVQAMTRLIRDLESSPFIENVQLKMSKAEDQQGSVVTSFQLDAAYQKPDSSVVVRAPFVASVR
jgi:Tfp pilus assembly protein PilN